MNRKKVLTFITITTAVFMLTSYYLTGVSLDLIILALLLFILFTQRIFVSSQAIHDREIKKLLTPNKFVYNYVAKHYPYITAKREQRLINAVLRIYGLSPRQAWFIYDNAVATFSSEASF